MASWARNEEALGSDTRFVMSNRVEWRRMCLLSTNCVWLRQTSNYRHGSARIHSKTAAQLSGVKSERTRGAKSPLIV